MSRNNKAPEPEGPNVPAYIVTFSDMVTLLLTFFVMLLSLAKTQDPELVDKGRESFVRSTQMMGLGMLFNRKTGPDFEDIKTKHSAAMPPVTGDLRLIDAEDEITRRIFEKVANNMATLPSQLTAEKTDFVVTDIKFGRAKAELGDKARKFLTEFYKNIKSQVENGSVRLYVLGMANDVGNDKERFFVSAQRAQNVADFLSKLIGEKPRRYVFSWGAGDGGDWVDSESPASKDSQILIAVLRQR